MKTDFLTKVADVFVILGEFFIEIHKMGIDMIMEGKNQISYDLVESLIDMVSGVILIVLLLVVDLSIIYGIWSLFCRISIWIRTGEIKRYPVTGKVTDKEYEEDTGYVYNTILNCMMLSYSSEEYNISVEYKEIEEIFDDEDLFNQYEEGDSISLILVQKLNKKGEIIEETLELPE